MHETAEALHWRAFRETVQDPNGLGQETMQAGDCDTVSPLFSEVAPKYYRPPRKHNVQETWAGEGILPTIYFVNVQF
jgi:hypothetical protein